MTVLLQFIKQEDPVFVASAAGIRTNSMVYYWRKDGQPSLKTVQRIAEFLGTTLDVLCKETTEKEAKNIVDNLLNLRKNDLKQRKIKGVK